MVTWLLSMTWGKVSRDWWRILVILMMDNTTLSGSSGVIMMARYKLIHSLLESVNQSVRNSQIKLINMSNIYISYH